MSPDIEWQVGEEAERETIARTTSARRSTRSRWAVIGAIGLGVALALLYRSIPEPTPRAIDPLPAPAVITSPLSPVPTVDSLAAAVERDALRLASSAGETKHLFTFEDAADPYADWYATLQDAFGRWGAPPTRAVYTIVASGTLSSGTAWVTVRQFRHGGSYWQTRFYRLDHGGWVWTLPDRSFWSGKRAVVSAGDAGTIGPIAIGHPIEDAPIIGAVFDRFTRAYHDLCEALNCPPPSNRAQLWTPGLTLSLTIKPMFMQPVVQELNGTLYIDLPSPNVVGAYEQNGALGDPYLSMAYDTLIDPVVRLASGDYARWDTNDGGRLFLQASAIWLRARLPNNLYLLDAFFQRESLWPSLAYLTNGQPVSRRADYVNQLRGTSLIPLTDVWTWPKEGTFQAAVDRQALQEAKAMIIFIEEKYGRAGVIRFLNSLGTARSLETAIKTALAISYTEFDRQWNQWITGK